MKPVKVEHPKMLEKIENDDYRQWALELHQIWQQDWINTPSTVEVPPPYLGL